MRRLGKTNLMVSEVGFGGEWLGRHEEEESINLIRHAQEKGINIIDCWMPDPKSRDIIGKAIAGSRERWFVRCTSAPPGRAANMCAPATWPL